MLVTLGHRWILGVSRNGSEQGLGSRDWCESFPKNRSRWKFSDLKQESNRHVGLGVLQVDRLLTQLASLSPFSHSSVQRDPNLPSSRIEILKILYSSLSPAEASFLTQIILKDLRPILYPSKETHYTAALKHQKSNSVAPLNVADALKAWDPTLHSLSRWRVVSSFEVALSSGDHGIMCVGNPLQVSERFASRLRKLNESAGIWVFRAPLDSEDRQGHRVHSSPETFLELSTRLGRNQVRRRASPDPRQG